MESKSTRNGIQTVLGTISRDELGLVAPHEHFFIDTTFEALLPENDEQRELFYSAVNIGNIDVLRRNPFLVRDNMVLDNFAVAAKEVKRFKKAGGSTVVDLTSIGIKRDLTKIRKLSEETGVNIIAGCGFYTEQTVPGYYRNMTAHGIADLLIREITEGDPESGVKPGVIGEIGTSRCIEPFEETSLRASAYASIETGLPIYVHTYPWTKASLKAVDILLGEGVAPSKICVCHLDVSFDYDCLCSIFDKGVYAMFDNFGKEYYFTAQDSVFAGGPFETDIDRVRMIKRIILEKRTDRLLLATDVCLKSLLHSYGGWGYDHIFSNVIPMMENEGIERDDIERIIKINPTRFLVGE